MKKSTMKPMAKSNMSKPAKKGKMAAAPKMAAKKGKMSTKKGK
jgi:hypothetical protein